jgi:CheY-like chemotaxis protein
MGPVCNLVDASEPPSTQQNIARQSRILGRTLRRRFPLFSQTHERQGYGQPPRLAQTRNLEAKKAPMPIGAFYIYFYIYVDASPFSAQTLAESLFPKRARSFRECRMYRPPPVRGRRVLAEKKVFLIDRCQATREVRAAVLRSHGVEVHFAEEISSARFLGQPHVYDLVMLDVRRYSPEETLEFYGEVKNRSPRERFVFLLGPPRYLSLTWPGEVAGDDVSRGQWGETVKHFLAAA